MTTQTFTTEIDQEAPVIARDEIEINAPPETVWEVMADLEHWPQWNLDVTWARLDGDLIPGSTFKWKAGPGIITSTLQHVERPMILAWTGKTLGIKAVHFWKIEVRNDGALVRTEESWDGLPVRIFRSMMQKTLDQSIAQGLRYLKAEAESRSKN